MGIRGADTLRAPLLLAAIDLSGKGINAGQRNAGRRSSLPAKENTTRTEHQIKSRDAAVQDAPLQRGPLDS